MAIILVIDDDLQIGETMQRMVARAGHQALTAPTLSQGLALLQAKPVDVVFLDVRLPDGDGLEALPDIRRAPSRPEVIVLTGQGSVDGAATAIHGGVWDYLTKPMSLQDTMHRLERALAYRESARHQNETPLSLNNVVGVSPEFRTCLDQVAKAARSEAPALITGETGTGKELMARTIHSNSARRERPFIVVDCAALSETLIESLLFGHKKGSFTGAHADSLGLIRAADNGVFFLDEVGELSLTAQKTFLRVLQEKRFRPVGEIREFSSDFRLLAATNRNLAAMVEKGQFRSDLFFRLKAIEVPLPPLRLRLQDIALLAMYRTGALAQTYGMPRKSLDPEFLDHLRLYHWPGNVRELFGVIETAFVAGWDSTVIYPRHLPSNVRIAVATQKLQLEGPAAPDATTGYPTAFATPPPKELALHEQPPSLPLPAQHSPPLPEPARGLPTPKWHEGEFPSLKTYKAAMESAYLQALQQRADGDIDTMVALSGLSKSHLYALLKKNRLPVR